MRGNRRSRKTAAGGRGALLYPRLAAEGIRKNKRTYVPYLLTCVTMVMVSYLLFFLMQSESIASMRGGDTLQAMLSLGSGIFCIFAVIFLFYTNSFLIRQRKREFGLYNILGMGKWNLARILVWESVLMALISFAGGLALGILFSKLAELAMAKVLGAGITYLFSVEWRAVTETLVIFAVIFGLILLNSLRQVQFASPIELLRGSTVGEKPPKGNVFLAAVGFLLLAAAYYLAVSIEDPLMSLYIFFLAVLMVIVATYLLFIAGSVVLCRILKKKKSYYYKTNHFVSISSMQYRMKRNGAGLASICILSTMVLVMVSATVSLYVGEESALRESYPRDLQILSAVEDGERGAIRREVEQVMEEAGSEMLDMCVYRYLSFAGCMEGSSVSLDRSSVKASDFSKLVNLVLIPLEDYNVLAQADEQLDAEDEVLVYCIRGGNYGYDTVSLDGYGTLRVKKEVPEFVSNTASSIQVVPSIFLVVRDMEVFQRLNEFQRQMYGENASTARGYCGFNMEEGDEEKLAVYQRIEERLNERQAQAPENAAPYSISCIANERSFFYGMYGGLFVLGILLGSVFILAAVLIMYYKQITEGYEDQARFEVMQKVGMTAREIRKSINSQMLTVFFLPLLLAGLHQAFAFPIVWKMLMLFGLTDKNFVIMVVTVCFLVFAVFYVTVYRLTSRTYCRIVGGGKGMD